MKIKIITSENLNQVPFSMLEGETGFQQMEDLVYDIEASKEPDRARNAFLDLTKILDQAGPAEQAEAGKYIPMLIALRLMSLLVVTDEEKEKFLRENTAAVFSQSYADVKYWIQFLFMSYDYDKDISIGFQRIFIRALETSMGRLGKGELVLLGQSSQPLVKNWLVDYKAYPSAKAQKEDIDLVTYVSQSPNTRILSPSEKKALTKLLQAYDWLRFKALHPARYEEYRILHDRPVNVISIELPEIVIPAHETETPKEITDRSVPVHSLSVVQPPVPSVQVKSAEVPAPPVVSRPVVSTPRLPSPAVQANGGQASQSSPISLRSTGGEGRVAPRPVSTV
ncbi:hypothetical protein D4R52_01145, partial [bacterium]